MKRDTLCIAYPSSTDGYRLLAAVDKQFIGTDDYMGITYFWAYAYRHALRDASPLLRVKVHAAMVKAGMDPVGESDAHAAIVAKFCKGWR